MTTLKTIIRFMRKMSTTQLDRVRLNLSTAMQENTHEQYVIDIVRYALELIDAEHGHEPVPFPPKDLHQHLREIIFIPDPLQ